MAALTTDIQGLMAAGGAARADRWYADRRYIGAVASKKRHHINVIAPMPSTSVVEKFNGTARRSTEGSS